MINTNKDNPHIPVSVEFKAVFPDEDFFGHEYLPYKSVAPSYEATVDILVGDKVHSYSFRSTSGVITVRDATLREWKRGQKINEVFSDEV